MARIRTVIRTSFKSAKAGQKSVTMPKPASGQQPVSAQQSAAKPKSASAPKQASAQQSASGPKSVSGQNPVPAQKSERPAVRLAVIPTGSGNIAFSQVAFSLLGITGDDRKELVEFLESRGAVVCGPGKKTQYLIYEAGKAESMAFFKKAQAAEKAGEMRMYPREVFDFWTKPGNRLPSDFQKQLEIVRHYLMHAEDWKPDCMNVIPKVEKTLLKKSFKIIEALSEGEHKEDKEDEEEKEVLLCYFDWGRSTGGAKWMNEQDPEFMTHDASDSVLEDYLMHPDDWRAAKAETRERLEHFISGDAKRLAFALCARGHARSVCALLDKLSEMEAKWTESGFSDGFYVFSLLNLVIDHSIQDGSTEVTAYLMDYKAAHFDAEFADAASSAEMDREFGLAEKPGVYYEYDPSETILFGAMQQSSLAGAKPEPIEWEILKKEEGRMLIYSKKVLTSKPYHERDESVTWKNCTLRAWLNGRFYCGAFTEEERTRILTVTNRNPDNPLYHTTGGEDTEDRIFLLSIDDAQRMEEEAERSSSRERMLRKPTDFAKKKGVWTDSDGYCDWRLRTPGSTSRHVAEVTNRGWARAFGEHARMEHGICPAMWIKA